MNLKNTLLIICLAFISEGYSWWDEGHSLVCNKAANLMSTDTSANLFSILESDDYGEGCVWPDVIKQVERRETRPWHYINLPPGKDLITPEACPEKGCLMRAYEEQLSLLRTGNDAEKKDAVRFIGHFVADIHQPLHTGFGYDRGGNDHLLTLQGKKKSNMHSIWDGEILEFLYKTKGKNDVQTEEDLKNIFPKKSWNKLHLQIIWFGREYCKARDCYGISCKICKSCYPNRKKPIKTNKA